MKLENSKKVNGMILLLVSLSLFANSCEKNAKSSKLSSPPPPVAVQMGKMGEQPTAVWPNYDWVITKKGM